MAVVSICFNPLFTFSVMAVLTCVGAVTTVVRHPEYHAYMGWKVGATWAFAILGILAALVNPAVRVLAIGANAVLN